MHHPAVIKSHHREVMLLTADTEGKQEDAQFMGGTAHLEIEQI